VPIAPLAAGVPVAVAALSYAGELVVSIQVDGAVDDLEVLAAGITEGLDQLMPPRPSGDRGGTSLCGGW
jgi:diacylglycerol O-acyltransferase / wax synthase